MGKGKQHAKRYIYFGKDSTHLWVYQKGGKSRRIPWGDICDCKRNNNDLVFYLEHESPIVVDIGNVHLHGDDPDTLYTELMKYVKLHQIMLILIIGD